MFGMTKERPRVVATGVGAITSQGPTADALWEGVKSARVAIRPVQRLSMEGYRTTLGGEVRADALPEHDYPRPEDVRERFFDYAFKAAEEAIRSCGISATHQIPPERWGVVIGTCNAGIASWERWYMDTDAGKPSNPALLLLVPPQSLAEALAGVFGARGPVLSINTACAASANAIGYGAELIRQGQTDAVITGGAEVLSNLLFSGFNCLESLSPEPAAPYSRNRAGLSLGEGSGMIVLMREDLAREYGAPVLAEIRGYSLSADGYHPTAPHPEGQGAARAIKAALEFSGVTPEQVAYVNSHGTGTPKNDPAETAATKIGLGEHAYKAAVSSTKSMIGHLLGAAGAVESIVTVKALAEQTAPPTANYTEPDPECDLDYVPNHARPLAMDVAVSNNFAFGGANASLVWAKIGACDDPPPTPEYDRVVVTGLGALTSAGTDVDALWQAFVQKRVMAEEEDGVWLGRVPLDLSAFLSPKERKRVDRLGVFSIIASRLALEDAGLELTDGNRARVGVIIGTAAGPWESIAAFAVPLFTEGPSGANPALFPNTVYNAAGGQVAMKVGAIGVASTVTAGHAAGASAMCYGFDLVAAGQADVVVAIAADALHEMVIRGYREFGVLATSNPGAGDSDGFALSEAGVALTLERLSSARARGARVYGEIRGYGITSDGMGLGSWNEEGHGIERAMRLALERAGLEPEDVGTFWASSAGLAAADEPERLAIQRVFGEGANVVAPKVLLGEPMGAGGSLNAVLALRSWQEGEGRPALVNSCSLGGTNFAVVLAPWSS
jgi:3-oxoacyl-[acyl-carrier-protein] synthase II